MRTTAEALLSRDRGYSKAGRVSSAPLDLFDKSYGSFPTRVSPIGGTFGRIEMFAYLCSNDFPTPPGSACLWVPLTVNRSPIGAGTIPGRTIPNVFRVTFQAQASEVGDEDLTTPGKVVPILVQAKIVQSGVVVLMVAPRLRPNARWSRSGVFRCTSQGPFEGVARGGGRRPGVG